MRVRLWIKVLVMSSALCLAGLPAAAQQQQDTGDPLADAARKARQSKKDAPKAKRVITDDDLKKSAPDTTPTPAATGAPGTTAATTGQASGDAAKGQDPNGEAAWRKRFKDAHDQIAKAEKELDILSRELEKAQTEYYPDPQKALTQQNTRADINDKTAKIDAKKKEIAQLKQALDDMEDQLRKSGGDPGWAR